MEGIATLRLPHAKDQSRAYLLTCLSKIVTQDNFVPSFHFHSTMVDQQIGLLGMTFIISINYDI